MSINDQTTRKLRLPEGMPPDRTVSISRDTLECLGIQSADEWLQQLEKTDGIDEFTVKEPHVRSRLGLAMGMQRYSCRALIGEGATGYVYSITDHNCDREVAVKIPKGENASRMQLERFLTEAGVSARLEHPNIVPIYEINADVEGRPYMVMRKVQGHTLKHHVEGMPDGKKSLIESEDDLLLVFLKICDALSYAHSRGHVHQDIKPENIMIGRHGEVFLIDWGASSTGGGSDDMSVTPIYMSPQQALGMRPTKADDVYCLGATMFHCLTGRFPTCAETLDELVQRKQRGEIDPPTAEERSRVPTPLLAIAMKALELDPAARYGDASEMAADIKNYQNGQRVNAHSYTLRDFLLQWYRRHRHAVWIGGLLLLLVGGAGYMVLDHMKTFGKWQEVYYGDYTRPDADLSQLSFCKTRFLDAVRRTKSSPDGLLLKEPDMFWLRDLQVSGSVRVDVTVNWPEVVDGLEMHINARRVQPKRFYWCPPGYSCQFGGFSGTINLISRNDESQRLNTSNAIPAKLRPNTDYILTFELIDDELRMLINGDEIYSQTELLPFDGAGFDNIAIRSWTKVHIKSLRVYRRALPQKASPLVAGDVFVEEGKPEIAVRRYIDIANDYPGTKLAERGLAKAFTASIRFADPTAGEQIRKDLLARLREEFPGSPYELVMLEIRAIHLWEEERHREAMSQMPRIFEKDPGTRVIMRILDKKHVPLTDEVAQSLLGWIAKTRDVQRLDLREFDLKTLEPLRGMPLTSLSCPYNQLTDLRGLEGMPLADLDCSNNQISDLSVLSTIPTLKSLGCVGNRIVDLSPLQGARLNKLSCGYNWIESLEPLRGTPLIKLNAYSNNISDLSPLKGMPIADLNLGGNRIKSLDPLQGMPLDDLTVSENAIVDLTPLSGAPLVVLGIANNQVESIDPIAGAPLKELKAERNRVRDLSPLKGNAPSKLSLSGNPITDVTPLAGKDFNYLMLSDTKIRSLDVFRGARIGRLDIANCGIQDLSPLAEANISSLDCSSNLIRSLEPLASLELKSLRCYGNPLQSLKPYEEQMPPEDFYFDEVQRPDSYIDGLLACWQSNGFPEDQALEIRKLRALQKGDVEGLKALGAEHHGRHYVFLSIRVTFDEARSMAKRVGAHLATITSEAELRAFRQSGNKRFGGWLGLTKNEKGENTWITGEPFDFHRFSTPRTLADARPAIFIEVSIGEVWSRPLDGTDSGLVLEWED